MRGGTYGTLGMASLSAHGILAPIFSANQSARGELSEVPLGLKQNTL